MAFLISRGVQLTPITEYCQPLPLCLCWKPLRYLLFQYCNI